MEAMIRESERKLLMVEAKIEGYIKKLVEMDREFRRYILPPLPHEILSFLNTLSDCLSELQTLISSFRDYRQAVNKAVEELAKK